MLAEIAADPYECDRCRYDGRAGRLFPCDAHRREGLVALAHPSQWRGRPWPDAPRPPAGWDSARPDDVVPPRAGRRAPPGPSVSPRPARPAEPERPLADTLDL